MAARGPSSSIAFHPPSIPASRSCCRIAFDSIPAGAYVAVVAPDKGKPSATAGRKARDPHRGRPGCRETSSQSLSALIAPLRPLPSGAPGVVFFLPGCRHGATPCPHLVLGRKVCGRRAPLRSQGLRGVSFSRDDLISPMPDAHIGDRDLHEILNSIQIRPGLGR